MLIKFNNIKNVSVVMIYNPLKLQLRAFLADQTVSTLMTYYVTKMITYLPMIGSFFNTMIVASSDRMVIMTHQNLTAGICFEPPWKVSRIF